MRWRSLTDRLPLRTRLMAGFLSATFVILLGAGVFVYWRFDVALNRDLDLELITSASTLAPLVGQDGSINDRVLAAAPGVSWQVLDRAGAVLDSDGPATRSPMLSAVQFDRVKQEARTFNVGAFLPASAEPYRVRVIPIDADHHLLVAARRDHRDDALRDLFGQLLVAGVGVLAVIAFVGDRLARAALHPVEVYRRRAEEITAGNAELRLDVPVEHDDEITRLGHTFNAMLASLDRALTSERRFVVEASHELRTPITLLSSRIQLARRRARSPEEHEAILTELQVDVDRLAELTEQLLERRGSRHAEASCDLVQTVSRVLAGRWTGDPAGAREVTAQLPVGPLRVAMADLEVERIVTNLLDNAAVHGRPPVVLAVEVAGVAWARLMVRDHGAGMEGELLARATARFARAAGSENHRGMGLGLALVRDLVVERGGELRLCHGEHHVRYGERVPAPCEHSASMVVTVLLPTSPRPEEPTDAP